MTVSTLQSQSVLLGNGSTSSFNFSFNNGVPFNSNTSLANYTVIYSDVDGNEEVLDPSVYSISFTAAATGTLWGIGGTLVYPISGSPIASGTSLTLSRIFPLQQLTSISNQGDFSPEVIEVMGDIEEMQLQQIAARTGALRGIWATGVQYNYSDVVVDGANGTNTGNYYSCVLPNISGTWSTDLANGDWSLAINVQIIEGYAASAAASASTATTEAGISTTQAGISTTQAGISTAQAVISTTQAGIATTAATQASNYAASYSGTSTTSIAIATGAKTFTTQASKLWVGGQYLQIASNASALNYMHGTVTSYSGTTLVMNITDIGGSGTHTDWNISISGTQGPTGPSGGGAVTTVSVVSANGLAGSVANPTTTPAITLSTSITGILKGDGTAISAATAGTDYVTASSTNTFTNKTYDTADIGNVFKVNGTQITSISGNTAKVATTTGTLTSGHVATFDASGNIQDGGGAVIAVVTKQILTASSGTYTPTIGMVYCVVRAVGGGGGGGGGGSAGSGSGGSGGGAGEYFEGVFSAATIGVSKPYVCGAIASGGATTANGSDGNVTTLGTAGALVSCAGGSKGLAGGGGGVAGGLGGTSGTFSNGYVPGQSGLNGADTGSGPGAGNGGNAPGFGAGGGGAASTNAGGAAAVGFGGGGGGGTGSGSGNSSGAGAIIITEYCT